MFANNQQLSDLLSYEEAVALKDLAAETQMESRFMCQMAVRQTLQYEGSHLTLLRRKVPKMLRQSKS